MKKHFVILMTGLGLCASSNLYAGNKDRSGQGSATELLVNPWAASGGLFGLDAANVSGVEAMKVNIAGISSANDMEFGAVHNTYIRSSGISMIDAGIVKRMGKSGKNTVGVNLMSINYGDIPNTTVDNPNLSAGTYKPSFFNISIGYAHDFAKSITAGINFTFIQEGVPNVKSNAMGIDMGIKYTTGRNDNLHFGVTLRNVGTNIRFQGDGLSFSGLSPDQSTELTVQQRSEKFQLPTQLNIAVANDFYLGKRYLAVAKPTTTENEDGSPIELSNKTENRLSAVGSFISNSFNNDYMGVGLEYAFKESFMLRTAYRYEANIANISTTTTFYKGLAVGAGVQFASGKGKIAIDYCFKPTRFSTGVHTVGVRFIK